MSDISKIKIGTGSAYTIKDATARTTLAIKAGGAAYSVANMNLKLYETNAHSGTALDTVDLSNLKVDWLKFTASGPTGLTDVKMSYHNITSTEATAYGTGSSRNDGFYTGSTGNAVIRLETNEISALGDVMLDIPFDVSGVERLVTFSEMESAMSAMATSSTITDLANRISTLETWKDAFISTTADSDTIINKWNEVVTFLDQIDETPSLASLLSAKANASDVVTAVSYSSGTLTYTKNSASNNITTASTIVTDGGGLKGVKVNNVSASVASNIASINVTLSGSVGTGDAAETLTISLTTSTS